jgi:Tfp pilus assembly protein PilN
MIKINLLPARKAKRSAADPSSQQLLLGVGALVAAGAAVFLLVDKPRRDELSDLQDKNQRLAGEIATKNKQLVGYSELKAANEEVDKRYKSIKRLVGTQVVPANVLHELGQILSPGGQPTMTEQMVLLTGSGPLADSNKHFQGDWDATHVWLSGFTDTGGVFKLEGGAQSESDVTQLSKRMAASVYFLDVSPSGGERVADAASGLNYYKFTITGKVAY